MATYNQKVKAVLIYGWMNDVALTQESLTKILNVDPDNISIIKDQEQYEKQVTKSNTLK